MDLRSCVSGTDPAARHVHSEHVHILLSAVRQVFAALNNSLSLNIFVCNGVSLQLPNGCICLQKINSFLVHLFLLFEELDHLYIPVCEAFVYLCKVLCGR